MVFFFANNNIAKICVRHDCINICFFRIYLDRRIEGSICKTKMASFYITINIHYTRRRGRNNIFREKQVCRFWNMHFKWGTKRMQLCILATKGFRTCVFSASCFEIGKRLSFILLRGTSCQSRELRFQSA